MEFPVKLNDAADLLELLANHAAAAQLVTRSESVKNDVENVPPPKIVAVKEDYSVRG